MGYFWFNWCCSTSDQQEASSLLLSDSPLLSLNDLISFSYQIVQAMDFLSSRKVLTLINTNCSVCTCHMTIGVNWVQVVEWIGSHIALFYSNWALKVLDTTSLIHWIFLKLSSMRVLFLTFTHIHTWVCPRIFAYCKHNGAARDWREQSSFK